MLPAPLGVWVKPLSTTEAGEVPTSAVGEDTVPLVETDTQNTAPLTASPPAAPRSSGQIRRRREGRNGGTARTGGCLITGSPYTVCVSLTATEGARSAPHRAREGSGRLHVARGGLHKRYRRGGNGIVDWPHRGRVSWPHPRAPLLTFLETIPRTWSDR